MLSALPCMSSPTGVRAQISGATANKNGLGGYRDTSRDDNKVATVERCGEVIGAVALGHGVGEAVVQVCRDTGDDRRHVVAGELSDQRVELEQQRERLSDAARSAEHCNL